MVPLSEASGPEDLGLPLKVVIIMMVTKVYCTQDRRVHVRGSSPFIIDRLYLSLNETFVGA
jgi:hypothetical protein